MRIVIIVALSFLYGCSAVEIKKEYASIPSCSKVTISKRAGANHWTECNIDFYAKDHSFTFF